MASGAGSYWVLTRLRSLPDIINTLNGERQLVTAALRHPNFLDARGVNSWNVQEEISDSFTPPAVIHLVSSSVVTRTLPRKTPPGRDDPDGEHTEFPRGCPRRARIRLSPRLASRLLPTAVSPALLIHAGGGGTKELLGNMQISFMQMGVTYGARTAANAFDPSR